MTVRGGDAYPSSLGMPIVGSHTQITAGNMDTAQSLTAPATAYGLLVQAFTQNVRFTLDGTVPTSTKGFRITASNDAIKVSLIPGQVVKVISETAGAAIEYQWLGN